MINIRQIQDLPPNLEVFVHEMGEALRAIYGHEAEAANQGSAEAGYARLFAQPEVAVLAAGGPDPAGLLVAVTRRGIGYITLCHVLNDAAENGLGAALVHAAVEGLRAQSVDAIIGEFVGHRPLEFDAAFRPLGFHRIDRQLMMADLNDRRLAATGPIASVPCGVNEPAARVLIDAYADHPSRVLHPEAHAVDGAIAFLTAFRNGDFGTTAPPFFRVFPASGECTGMIAAAEAVPNIGFILHVATARKAQGQGIGTRLIREIAGEFRHAGYRRVALGVTCGNPAERLYERLGFQHLAPVESYVWWADPRRYEPC